MSEKKQEYYVTLTKDVLTLQLLETELVLIEQIRNYAKENRIVLKEEPSLNLLLAKARNIINEMDNDLKVADESKQSLRTDEEGTVPQYSKTYRKAFREVV